MMKMQMLTAFRGEGRPEKGLPFFKERINNKQKKQSFKGLFKKKGLKTKTTLKLSLFILYILQDSFTLTVILEFCNIWRNFFSWSKLVLLIDLREGGKPHTLVVWKT